MFLRQLTKSRLPISRLPRHINIIQQSMKPSFFSTHAIDIKDQRIDSALDRKLQEQPRKTNLKRTVTRREYNNDRLDVVFAEMDASGKGTITREQFQEAIEKIEQNEFGKLRRSLSRNELSRTGSRNVGTPVPLMFDDVPVPVPVLDSVQSELSAPEVAVGRSLSDIIVARMSTSAEVAISKIFMAGFGWQGASCIADAYGFAADTSSFALITGVGDFTGVCIGHTGWMIGKSMLVDDSIDTTAEFHTGILLGTAAFFSGTTWQPLVNLLHDTLHLSFNTSVGLTTIGCGTAFYIGLRLARSAYSPFLYGVEPTNYSNLKADAALSLSVGAATGCFVGTDLSFGAANWMGSVLGVQDGFGSLHGMMLAGTSTAIGFTAVQSIQNLTVKPGRNWVD